MSKDLSLNYVYEKMKKLKYIVSQMIKTNIH